MSTIKQTPWVVQYGTKYQDWTTFTPRITKEEACTRLARMTFIYPHVQFRIQNEVTGEVL